MKRYQNPEIFERLAMSYALGTLQGRARQRFERLLEQHFYLRAVTEAYQQQVNGMVEILKPVKPPPQVWQKLEKELELPSKIKVQRKAKQANKPFWSAWQWPVSAVAGVLLGFFVALGMETPIADKQQYASIMKSDSDEPMALATVSREDMQLSVKLIKAVNMPSNSQLTLWCYPKEKGGKIMRMATLSTDGETQMDIDKSMWRGLRDVSEFVISAEPMDQPDAKQPMGDVMYKGILL